MADTGNQLIRAIAPTCQAGKGYSVAYEFCIACNAGQYSAAGSSGCSTCLAGEYSTAGSSSCSTCPVGQYSTAGSSNCSVNYGQATWNVTTFAGVQAIGVTQDSTGNLYGILKSRIVLMF